MGRKAERLLRPGFGEDVEEMMERLRSQFEKVKADAAFLTLKQRELRPGDQMSLFGFMNAQEEVRMEQSVLGGHAFMIQQELARRHCAADPKTRQFLAEILNYARGT